MTTYYRTNIAACTFGEIRRILWPSAANICIVASARLLGRPILAGAPVAHDSLKFLDPEELPAEARGAFAEVISDCRRHGFTPRLAVTAPVLGDPPSYSILCLDKEALTWGNVVWARSQAMEELTLVCISQCADGRFLSTTNGKRRLLVPPNAFPAYFPGACVDLVVERHRARIAGHVSELLTVDDDSLRRAAVSQNERVVEFHKSRGVFVPITPEEVKQFVR